MNFIFRHVKESLMARVRDYTNPYMGLIRCKFLKNKNITIISNNCWGGHCYRYFALPYDSPTIGLYIFPEDYIQLIKDLRKYMAMPLKFIKYTESKYSVNLKEKAQTNVPIGILGDVEMVFLHYKTEEEAIEKWNRRKSRIHWDNIFYKFAEMNGCTEKHLQDFDALPYNKFVFTSHKRPDLKSAVYYKGFEKEGQIENDTLVFNYGINLVKFFNTGSL